MTAPPGTRREHPCFDRDGNVIDLTEYPVRRWRVPRRKITNVQVAWEVSFSAS